MNDDDLARRRFFIIQALRLGGIALVVVGVAIIAGKLPLPEVAGYALFVAGAADALFVPPLLARIWRTPLP